MLPLIGITTYGRGEKNVSNIAFADHFCTPALYVDAIRRAGGTAVLLPTEEPHPARLLAALDGIVFSGGADIEPSEYGGNAEHPQLGDTHSQRDKAELTLMRAALRDNGIPLLFICRGMQLLNVAQGGTLYEHIEDLGNGDIHRCKTNFWARQPVEVVAGSRLHAAIQKSSVLTMSGHHQGLREVGANLTVSAVAEDGIIEAVEHDTHPFAIGVQWRPEASAASDADQQRLFDAFVAVAVVSAFALAGVAKAETAAIGAAISPSTLDPQLSLITSDVGYYRHIFDPLFQLDSNSQVTPGLATEYRAIDDTTWELKLRKGVKFHDGSDFDAQDIVFTLKRLGTVPGHDGLAAQYHSPIKETIVVDPHTIQFKTQGPKEEYTKALIAAVPRADKRLERFAVLDDGASKQQLTTQTTPFAARPSPPADGMSLLFVGDVDIKFAVKTSLFLSRREFVTAARSVSLGVAAGESIGIVGESGSGKSTLARAICGLQPIDAGTITFGGRSIEVLKTERSLRRLRLGMQMIFQDPFSSLNPRQRIGSALAEPMLVNSLADRGEVHDIARQTLIRVGLKASDAGKLPHQFSGGQRQRICIARALVMQPTMLICDEPTSALDVSVQARILNLLKDLQEERGLTLVFISHDLAVIRQMCDRVVVMQGERVCETAETETLFASPQDLYTRKLLNIMPKFTSGAHAST